MSSMLFGALIRSIIRLPASVLLIIEWGNNVLGKGLTSITDMAVFTVLLCTCETSAHMTICTSFPPSLPRLHCMAFDLK